MELCSLCDKTFKDQRDLNRHFNGREHLFAEKICEKVENEYIKLKQENEIALQEEKKIILEEKTNLEILTSIISSILIILQLT